MRTLRILQVRSYLTTRPLYPTTAPQYHSTTSSANTNIGRTRASDRERLTSLGGYNGTLVRQKFHRNQPDDFAQNGEQRQHQLASTFFFQRARSFPRIANGTPYPVEKGGGVHQRWVSGLISAFRQGIQHEVVVTRRPQQNGKTLDHCIMIRSIMQCIRQCFLTDSGLPSFVLGRTEAGCYIPVQ